MVEPVQEAEQAHADGAKDNAQVAAFDLKSLRGAMQVRSRVSNRVVVASDLAAIEG